MLEVLAPTMIDFAPPDLAAEMVPRQLRGDETWCQGFSEPGTGSNLASLACRATRTDEGWRVTGQKVWTSFAQYAQRCVLLTRTGTLESAHEQPVQVWQIGETTLVALGGEVVVDYALRLKRERASDGLWVAAYANDVSRLLVSPPFRTGGQGQYRAPVVLSSLDDEVTRELVGESLYAHFRESLDIILKLWTEDGPWDYAGKYWQVSSPAEMPEIVLRPHIRLHALARERGSVGGEVLADRQDVDVVVAQCDERLLELVGHAAEG